MQQRIDEQIVEVPIPQISLDSEQIVDAPVPEVDVREALQFQVRAFSYEIQETFSDVESCKEEFFDSDT